MHTVDDVGVVPAHVAGAVVGDHGLGGQAEPAGAAARVAEAAGPQAHARQRCDLLHLPALFSITYSATCCNSPIQLLPRAEPHPSRS